MARTFVISRLCVTPVNYVVQFSGPLASLTARDGVRDGLICGADRQYKDIFLPRRFFNSSLRPLFFLFHTPIQLRHP